MLIGPHNLDLRTVDGRVERIAPARDRRATVVVTTLLECPIGRAFTPEIERLAREYRPRGVRFVMAYADAQPAAIKANTKEFRIRLPAGRAERSLRTRLAARNAPTAALVAADGTLVYSGRIDDRFPALGVQRAPRSRDLRRALELFLAGRPVVPSRTLVVGCALPNG